MYLPFKTVYRWEHQHIENQPAHLKCELKVMLGSHLCRTCRGWVIVHNPEVLHCWLSLRKRCVSWISICFYLLFLLFSYVNNYHCWFYPLIESIQISMNVRRTTGAVITSAETRWAPTSAAARKDISFSQMNGHAKVSCRPLFCQ